LEKQAPWGTFRASKVALALSTDYPLVATVCQCHVLMKMLG